MRLICIALGGFAACIALECNENTDGQDALTPGSIPGFAPFPSETGNEIDCAALGAGPRLCGTAAALDAHLHKWRSAAGRESFAQFLPAA